MRKHLKALLIVVLSALIGSCNSDVDYDVTVDVEVTAVYISNDK